eukprot:g365.t1
MRNRCIRLPMPMKSYFRLCCVAALSAMMCALASPDGGVMDWGAALAIGVCENKGNYLRRQFSLPAPLETVAKATAHVAAPGTFKLLVNDQIASNHVLGAYSQFDTRVLYDSLDITPLLLPDCNALGIILGTGWYGMSDMVGGDGRHHNEQWGSWRHGIVHVSVTFKNGSVVQTAASDAEWTGAQGPLLMDHVYNGEQYDARMEQKGWASCKFVNTSSWAKVCTQPWPKNITLSPNTAPQTRIKAFAPSRDWQKPDAPAATVRVFDFGQNSAAQVEIELAGTKGQGGVQVRVRHAELLFPNGTLWHHYPNQREELNYTVRGEDDSETFSPLFTYMGFRFCEVSVSGSVRVQNITAYAVSSIRGFGENSSSISFSNEILGRIEQATRWSAMSNFQSIPTDCPQRERHGWMGDAHIAAESLIYSFDMHALYVKFLRDIADTQRVTNAMCKRNVPVSAISPAYPGMYEKCADGGPAWGAGYTILLTFVVRYYADMDTLRTFWPGVVLYMDSLEGLAKGALLNTSTYGDWCNIDYGMPQTLPSVKSCAIDSPKLSQCGCNPPPNHRKQPIVSAFYYIQQLEMMVEMAGLLGLQPDADKYAALAEQMRALFAERFVRTNSTATTVGEGFQTDFALALFLGLIPTGPGKTAVERALIDNVMNAHDGHLTTGMVGTKYLLPALSSIGQEGLEAAYTVATQDTMPSWGYWLSMGATTLYESWAEAGTLEQRACEAGSLNHIMLGSQVDWYYKVLGGINLTPKTIGWTNITLAPRVPAKLEWVSAKVKTVRGTVSSSWRQLRERAKGQGQGQLGNPVFLFNFSIPAGSTAIVELPLSIVTAGSSQVLDRTSVVWKDGKFVQGAAGITGGRVSADGGVVLLVGAGVHELRCSS